MKALFPILLGIVCSYACYTRAKTKKRNPELWAVLGFLFGIFAILVLAILP